jgi:hypothetical protein
VGIRWRRGRRARAVGVGGGDGGSAIGGGGELAGVAHSGAIGHSSMNQRHRDDAEAMGPQPCHLRGRGRLSAALAMAGSGGSSPELTRIVLEATIREDRGMGRKRGARRSSPSGNTETRSAWKRRRRGGADGVLRRLAVLRIAALASGKEGV